MKEKYDENKIKIAFSSVKQDILRLEKEIKAIKLSLLKIKEKIGLKNKNSKGSDGVQTTSLQHPYNKQQTNIEKLGKNLKDLDYDIKKFILSLTDREFLIFTLIYQQEDELKRPVTYEEISLKLKLSEAHIRGCVHNLISKKAPLIKKRTGAKIFLSIKEEFRSLKIGAKIIDFRRSFSDKTNLLGGFNI